MPIMRDKKGLAASAAGRAKNEKKKLPAAKSASKAAATKPAPAQPQTTNATPAKPAPVIAPKPAPMITPQKVSGDAKPVARPAAAPPVAAKETPSRPLEDGVRGPAPAPAKPSNVTPIKSASSEVAKASQQPTSPPARPAIDVRELAQAVIAHTTPALEAGFKKVDARLEKVEARIAAAEAAARSAEAKAAALDGIGERIDKIAKSTAKAAQAAEAMQKAAAKPEPVVPMGLEAELDQIGRTVKRAFVESFERSMDHVALPLVKVQRYIEEIARRAGTEAQGLSEHLSICVTSLGAVLTDLGVESFEPEAHEEFDPIIHQQVGDAHRADVTANAILKCVAPGYRSAGGHVLLPALVVVNRK